MKLGFIGTGHMASSIIKALKDNENYSFLLNNRTTSKAIALKEEIGDRAKILSIEDIVKESDYLFLGVKPTDLSELLNNIKDIPSHAAYVSMAAGYSIKEIETIIGNKPIIRIMPNTPVLVKEGTTFVCFNEEAKDRESFRNLMEETGRVYEIAEDMMDGASTIAGSGPAYLDYFIDAMAEVGQKMGFSKEKATEYILSMAKGTIKLDMESSKTPVELGKEVCSPGGSTIEGVNVFLNEGLYELTDRALMASYNKNKKMK